MPDMTEDVFAEYPFGIAALNKMKNITENFRLYEAERMNDGTMKVTGAEFREAKKGTYKDVLSVMIKGTQQTVYVTKADIEKLEE